MKDQGLYIQTSTLVENSISDKLSSPLWLLSVKLPEVRPQDVSNEQLRRYDASPLGSFRLTLRDSRRKGP